MTKVEIEYDDLDILLRLALWAQTHDPTDDVRHKRAWIAIVNAERVLGIADGELGQEV